MIDFGNVTNDSGDEALSKMRLDIGTRVSIVGKIEIGNVTSDSADEVEFAFWHGHNSRFKMSIRVSSMRLTLSIKKLSLPFKHLMPALSYSLSGTIISHKEDSFFILLFKSWLASGRKTSFRTKSINSSGSIGFVMLQLISASSRRSEISDSFLILSLITEAFFSMASRSELL